MGGNEGRKAGCLACGLHVPHCARRPLPRRSPCPCPRPRQMDTCTVNRIFSVVRAYGLLMAQPSLCEAAWSHT